MRIEDYRLLLHMFSCPVEVIKKVRDAGGGKHFFRGNLVCYTVYLALFYKGNLAVCQGFHVLF